MSIFLPATASLCESLLAKENQCTEQISSPLKRISTCNSDIRSTSGARVMILLIPYHADVPMCRVPWMNWAIIGITVLFFPLCVTWDDLTPLGKTFTLGGSSWLGVPGHLLVHGDILHLAGNMLFLWVFGNAVCAKVGNLVYFFVYLGLGVGAGLLSLAIDGRPSIGASGAINAIVGMFLVWYLLNEITCWFGYWFYYTAGSDSFSVSSYWMILLWLAFDIWGALRGEGNVGYVAHIAGFGLGCCLAILMLKLRWVRLEPGERSLLQIFASSNTRHKQKRSPLKQRAHHGNTDSPIK